MPENHRIDYAAELDNYLRAVVTALTEVEVYLPQVPADAVESENLFRWEATIWRAADVLATPDGPARRFYSKTTRLEHAARAWTRAAGAYLLYTQLPMPSREDALTLAFGEIATGLLQHRVALNGGLIG